jgi:hypothetical protein
MPNNRIGDTIEVYCSNNGKTVKGVLHRRSKDMIDVVIESSIKLTLARKPNTSLFVGNKSGLEFTVTML